MIEESKHYLLIVNHFPWGLRHHFVDQGQYNQSYGFSNNHIWMWELDHKEEWMLKNLCFQTVVLEKTLESPLDSKEIKPVTPKGNQPWIFIGRTHTEAEALILWPPDVKSWLVRKDPGAGEDWGPRGEGGVRGWDGWMASLTQRTWVWASSGREWRTGKPGVLWSTGSQRVGRNWETKQQQGLKNIILTNVDSRGKCLITASQTPSGPVFSLCRWQNWGPQRGKLCQRLHWA